MKTRAAIKVEHGKPLAVDEIELPDPAADEVLVKLFASGISTRNCTRFTTRTRRCLRCSVTRAPAWCSRPGATSVTSVRETA